MGGQPGGPWPVWLTARQAAGVLGLAEQTLAVWRMEGGGPTWVKMGAKAVRYRAEDVRKWIGRRVRGVEATGATGA